MRSRSFSASAAATACLTRSKTCIVSMPNSSVSWWRSTSRVSISWLDRTTSIDQGPQTASAVEEVFRLLAGQYQHIVVDAGCQLNPCSVAALYTAETIYLVANPDVPSIRNAQRLLERIAQLGACGDRVRVLLNRAAEPYPIPPAQIESALGCPIDQTFPSDYKTVSTALNSGVPLALTGNTDIASQFDRFTRRILDPVSDPTSGNSRSTFGLQRIASMW